MAKAIFISWSIALPEYCLQVPANRIAHVSEGGPFTAPQLKVIAEVCSLTTFAIFSSLVLKEKLRWVDLGAFALILAGVLLSLLTKPAATLAPPPPLPTPGVEASPPLPPPGGRKLMLESDIAYKDIDKSRPHGAIHRVTATTSENNQGHEHSG